MLDKIREIVVEQLGVDAEQVVPEANFVEDLGADSLDTVELIMAFEEEFDVEIPDTDAEKIKTVQEAIEEGKAYLKYQNQQHHDWDDFTKDIQIVSQEKSTADNIDEDALAMLEKYD